MTALGYADPEILVGNWLRAVLGGQVKVWLDPKPPADRWITAPWVWVQRGQGLGQAPLSLDYVLLDCDAYAANADHARALGQRVWAAMTLQLPQTTFENGAFVKSCIKFAGPSWAPDPKFKRAAAYEVVLHSIV